MLQFNRKRTLCCTLILVGIFCAVHSLLAQTQTAQTPTWTPLPQSPDIVAPAAQVPLIQTPPVQMQVQNPIYQPDALAAALSYTLTRTSSAALEQALRQVCGQRFAVESQHQYVFTTNKKNFRRQASLRIEPQSNKVHISGDKELSNQILNLLVAIDQPPPQGMGRQIVPFQYTPIDVLTKAFESYRTPPISFNSSVVEHLNIPPGQPNYIRQVTHQIESGGLGGATFDGGFNSGMNMQGGMMPATSMFGTPNVIGMPEDFLYMFIPDLDVIVVQAEGARLNRFIEMIRQLEELSKLNRPRIEVVYLKYVNNVALAGPAGVLAPQASAFLLRTIPGQAALTPMISPNAVMIAGWGEAMDAVKELIETLDQPTVTEHSRLHMFKLEHISALQARNVIQGTFPGAGASGFAARLQLWHEPRSNVLIVQGAPNEIDEVKKIIKEIDVEDSPFRLQMRVFPLKNSLATDTALTLTGAITGTATDGKVPTFDLLIQGPEGQRLIKSGIMTDVNVSTDVRNNQVIIRAPEGCIAFLEELIILLDKASPEAEIKIFQIEHGDADSLEKMLTRLIPSNMAGDTGPRLPGSAEGDALIPIRIAVDIRTNCIVAAGSAGDLRTIEALIESLDREDMLNSEVTVYRLRSMEATAVALTINEYIRSRREIRLATPGVIPPFQQIESEVIIVPDQESNSLIIAATPRYFDEVMNLIKEIDRSPPQVVIRVLIADVTLSDNKDWAIELGFQDPIFFKRGSGFSFNNTGPLPSGEVATGTVATQLLTNFGGARQGGGMVFAASSEYVNIMLRALQENQRLEVLSAPQIATMNNQQAVVSIGQTVPRQTGTRRYNNDTEVVIQDTPVNLMLNVTPTISPEGTIVMRVIINKDKVGELVTFSDGSSASAIDRTNLVTAVTATNNQTVILGGLIANEVQKVRRKVPLLGDVPVLGKLFRHESDKKIRKELLVILTPRIVDGQEDLHQITQMEMARMSFARRNVAQVYGDVGAYSVTDEQPYTGNAPIIRPAPVKIETLQRLEPQQFIAPVLPKKN